MWRDGCHRRRPLQGCTRAPSASRHKCFESENIFEPEIVTIFCHDGGGVNDRVVTKQARFRCFSSSRLS